MEGYGVQESTQEVKKAIFLGKYGIKRGGIYHLISEKSLMIFYGSECVFCIEWKSNTIKKYTVI